MVSFDSESAFDSMPHHGLMGALKQFDVEPSIIGAIQSSLKGRTFKVKMRAHGRDHHSNVDGISKGLPRGALQSPFWGLCF